MPTGYTAKIADGISFREFALDCARAFGACVTLRDKSGGGELIPDKFEVDESYVRAVDNAWKELESIDGMTEDQCKRAAVHEYENAVSDRERRKQEKDSLRGKYEQMLVEVERWTPPTVDHLELKAFMAQQIRDSITYDCADYAEPLPVKMTGRQWRQSERARRVRWLENAIKAHRDECERAERRTAWVRALRDSLGSAV